MPVSGHLVRRSAEFIANFQDGPAMKLEVSPWLIFLVLGVILTFGVAAFAVSLESISIYNYFIIFPSLTLSG